MMKYKSLTFHFIVAVSVFGLAFNSIDATNWKVDKAHSAINFTVKHFFTPVTGAFNDYEATINFDPENLKESKIDVKIMVNSIDTKNSRRDGHLQSDDFFGAESWPNITFKSNEIISTGGNEFVAKGTLTIKDISKEIELPFTLLGIRNHPRRESRQIAGITSSFTIDRTEYGVGTGDWASDAVVGDEVTVNLALELNADI